MIGYAHMHLCNQYTHIFHPIRPLTSPNPLLARNIIQDDIEAIDVLNRNNGDPSRVRNCVRLIVANLDVVSLRIVDYVESRLQNKSTSRMETIPILLTIDPSMVETALLQPADGTCNTAHSADLLSQTLERSVVCGYMSNDSTAAEMEKISSNIIKKYAFVFAAYSDLRAAKKEFRYPQFIGEFDENDGSSSPSQADGAEPKRYSLKAATKSIIKRRKVSASLSQLTAGSNFSAGQQSLTPKFGTKRKEKQSVGLSSMTLRPKMYRRGGPKTLPPSTPKNSAGHFIVGLAGASIPKHSAVDSPAPMNGSVSWTPKGRHHNPDTVHIAPDMAPFVMKQKPELGLERTSRGLQRDKVETLLNLMNEHQKAKVAQLSTGAKRHATASEQIRAIDNKRVITEVVPSSKPESDEKAKEKAAAAASRASNFAFKLKAAAKLRKDDAASQNEDRKEEVKEQKETGRKERRSTSGSQINTLSMAQVVIAALAKAKQSKMLAEVLKDAKTVPPDMLQYDLIEIKPGQVCCMMRCCCCCCCCVFVFFTSRSFE